MGGAEEVEPAGSDERWARPGSASARPTSTVDGGPDGPDPRRLHQLARSWSWAPWLLGGLVVLRLVAVAGLRTYLYVDSGEYDTLDLSGRWRRPWATPLLYQLAPGGDDRIGLAQAVVGALCWGALALAAAAWFRLPRVRLAVAATIAALACTTVVTSWDTAKLSESLALSLTVLLVAAALELVRRPTVGSAGAVAVVVLPWLFVRQSLLSAAYLVVLAVAAGAVVTWRRGDREPARLFGALALGLAVLSGLATASYARNQEVVRENLTVIVANRIATDPGRLAWFTDHGMPVPASGAMDPGSLRDDPAFAAWVAGEGRGTYAEFLLTHPWYSITEPLDDVAALRRPTPDDIEPQAAMLAPGDVYSSIRPVLPDVVERTLFQPGDTGAVVFALAGVGAWTAARWRRRRRASVVPLVLVGSSFASLFTGWHGATPELGRLAMLGAIGLRLGLLLQLAVLVEDALLERQEDPRPRRSLGGR